MGYPFVIILPHKAGKIVTREIHLGVFDLSSNIQRTYNVAKKDVNKSNPAHYIGNIPIFSVENTILQIIKEQNAASRQRKQITHVVLVLDHSGKNFRHEIYPDYKANRPPKEKELIIQLKIIERVFKNLGYSVVVVPDVESDDVIASIIKKCIAGRVKVTIFSRDKDLFALIDGDLVEIYSGMDKKFYNWNTVIESKGVEPSRITDMLVLVGDVADNIVGVKGIGDKSATAFLKTHTLADLKANPDLILESGVRGAKGIYNNFIASADQIELMSEVATMKSNISSGQTLKDWRFVRSKNKIKDVISDSIKELVYEGVIGNE